MSNLSPKQFEEHAVGLQYSTGPYGGRVEAIVGSAVVGTLHHAPDGFVDHVEVAPQWRRKGVATRMADHLHAQGIEPMFAEGGEDVGNTKIGAAFIQAYGLRRKTETN